MTVLAGHGRPGRLTLDVIGRYFYIYTPLLSQIGRFFAILYTAGHGQLVYILILKYASAGFEISSS
jgi:hypothetical protein